SDEGRLSVEMPVNDKHLRPGGTVSGPSMFALADVAFYLAILQKIGPEGLTVTTSATINFMRKPGLEPLVAIPQIHKLGRHLVVGNVLIYAASDPMFEKPVASASLTYSIPPKQETS
ncbi:MAG: PaaI family thioesterase, partial [Candidatus Puniceispirillaceae bacterium]